MPSSSEGLKLSKGFKLGRMIGQGAHGSVHIVVDKNGNETKWAAKACRFPTSERGAKKKEMKYDTGLIAKEFTFYCNDLTAVMKKDGMIPNMPFGSNEPENYYAEKNGHRIIVMEAMKGPLMSICKAFANGSETNLAPVASRLLSIVHTTHEKGFLVIDIKQDNFMLAYPSNKSKKIIDQIRMIDLALLQRTTLKEKKTDDFAGTPLYVSLHVHELTHASYRDDIFSTILVIAELCIIIKAIRDGTLDDYQSTRIPSFFPWSQEASDDDLFAVKEDQVNDQNSKFYTRMPEGVRKPIFRALQAAHDMDFGSMDAPDVLKHLSSLPTGAGQSRATPKRKTSKKTPPPKKSGTKRTSQSAKKEQASAKKARSPQSDSSSDSEDEVVVVETRRTRSSTRQAQVSSSVAKKTSTSREEDTKRAKAFMKSKRDSNKATPATKPAASTSKKATRREEAERARDHIYKTPKTSNRRLTRSSTKSDEDPDSLHYDDDVSMEDALRSDSEGSYATAMEIDDTENQPLDSPSKSTIDVIKNQRL